MIVKDADANEGFEDSYDWYKQNLNKDKKKLRQQKSGINQGSSTTHSRISDSVCIYTLGDAVKFSYAEYESLATGLAGLMASSMGGKTMDLKEVITQGGGQMLERVLGEAVVGIASAFTWCWRY